MITIFAILINNTLRPAPNKVHYGNNIILNPPESVLLELGYLPVTYTDMPTDAPAGQHYESYWEQTDEEIVQAWTLVDDPVESEPEISAEEALQIIMGVAE